MGPKLVVLLLAFSVALEVVQTASSAANCSMIPGCSTCTFIKLNASGIAYQKQAHPPMQTSTPLQIPQFQLPFPATPNIRANDKYSKNGGQGMSGVPGGFLSPIMILGDNGTALTCKSCRNSAYNLTIQGPVAICGKYKFLAISQTIGEACQSPR